MQTNSAFSVHDFRSSGFDYQDNFSFTFKEVEDFAETLEKELDKKCLRADVVEIGRLLAAHLNHTMDLG